MASPGLNLESPASLSPLLPFSTPLDPGLSGREATPGTTPYELSEQHLTLGSGNGGHNSNLRQGLRGDEIRQAHVAQERRRQAHAARFGLDRSPSRSAMGRRSLVQRSSLHHTSSSTLGAQSYDMLGSGWREPSEMVGDLAATSRTYTPLTLFPSSSQPSSPPIPLRTLEPVFPSRNFRVWDNVPRERTATQLASRFRTPRFSSAMAETASSAATHNRDNGVTAGERAAPTTQLYQQHDRLAAPIYARGVGAPSARGATQAAYLYNIPVTPGFGAAPMASGLNSLLASPTNSTISFATQAPSLFACPSPPLPNPFPSTSPATPHLHLPLSGITTLPTPRPGPLDFGRSSFYHPMNCRAEQPQPQQPENPWEARAQLLIKGFSPNYRGDPDLARNRSAAIPAEQNCSLFVVGLAPDVTTHELLSGIRGVGRVYATHINPPDPVRGHFGSAAKVVFFERAGAGMHLFTHTFLPSLPPSGPALGPLPTNILTGGSRQRASMTSTRPPASQRRAARSSAPK